MYFDFETLGASSAYKLLTATIVPRPIAWVTTVDKSGALNTGAFSFFNVMGKEPPLVAFCVMPPNSAGEFKGTAQNILSQNEFVVNLVNERLAQQMNVTAMDAPIGFNELAISGLKTLPSTKIKTPQIAEAPVSFECVNYSTILTGPNQLLVIGKVVAARIADELIIDKERHYIDTKSMGLIGRMHGSGFYSRSTDLFEMRRISFDAWQAEQNDLNLAK